jgi:hypothetical protein
MFDKSDAAALVRSEAPSIAFAAAVADHGPRMVISVFTDASEHLAYLVLHRNGIILTNFLDALFALGVTPIEQWHLLYGVAELQHMSPCESVLGLVRSKMQRLSGGENQPIQSFVHAIRSVVATTERSDIILMFTVCKVLLGLIGPQTSHIVMQQIYLPLAKGRCENVMLSTLLRMHVGSMLQKLKKPSAHEIVVFLSHLSWTTLADKSDGSLARWVMRVCNWGSGTRAVTRAHAQILAGNSYARIAAELIHISEDPMDVFGFRKLDERLRPDIFGMFVVALGTVQDEAAHQSIVIAMRQLDVTFRCTPEACIFELLMTYALSHPTDLDLQRWCISIVEAKHPNAHPDIIRRHLNHGCCNRLGRPDRNRWSSVVKWHCMPKLAARMKTSELFLTLTREARAFAPFNIPSIMCGENTAKILAGKLLRHPGFSGPGVDSDAPVLTKLVGGFDVYFAADLMRDVVNQLARAMHDAEYLVCLADGQSCRPPTWDKVWASVLAFSRTSAHLEFVVAVHPPSTVMQLPPSEQEFVGVLRAIQHDNYAGSWGPTCTLRQGLDPSTHKRMQTLYNDEAIPWAARLEFFESVIRASRDSLDLRLHLFLGSVNHPCRLDPVARKILFTIICSLLRTGFLPAELIMLTLDKLK